MGPTLAPRTTTYPLLAVCQIIVFLVAALLAVAERLFRTCVGVGVDDNETKPRPMISLDINHTATPGVKFALHVTARNSRCHSKHHYRTAVSVTALSNLHQQEDAYR